MRIKFSHLGAALPPVMDAMPNMDAPTPGPGGAGGAGVTTPIAPSSGASFTNIASGISSILTPLLTAGVNIYAAEQQMRLQKQLLKNQAAMPVAQPMIIQQGGLSTGVIIAIAGAVFLLIIMIMMMSRSGGSSYSGPAVIGGAATAGGTPQVRVVRRVRRKPNSKRKRK